MRIRMTTRGRANSAVVRLLQKACVAIALARRHAGLPARSPHHERAKLGYSKRVKNNSRRARLTGMLDQND